MNCSATTAVRTIGLVAVCFAGVAHTGAAEKNAREAGAVERVIRASAQALSDFPRTLDAQAVLAFYASGFVGIENGEETNLDDQRELLSDLRDQIAAGTRVLLTLRAANIRVRVSGGLAVATYDYEFRIGVAGEFTDEEAGKCTSILEKSGSTWRFRHEHCSSSCPECDDEGPEDDPSLRSPERT